MSRMFSRHITSHSQTVNNFLQKTLSLCPDFM